jgi:hypothetical protein
MPRPDGILALASESGSALQRTIKAHLSSVQNALHPEIEAVFHLEPVRAAIGMVITFCALWFLIVFILYQLMRIALRTTI